MILSMLKKITIIITFVILTCPIALGAIQTGKIQYDSKYVFKKGDETKFLQLANTKLLLGLETFEIKQRTQYLQDAMRYYFLLSQINPQSIDAQIGLARVYDEFNLDKYAQKHFFVALDFDAKNPKANSYFANYYYKREDLIAAEKYYKRAYQFGYANNFEVNYRLATIYEKLADIEKAKSFYINSLYLMPSNKDLEEKIRLLDELNYSQSQYYLYSRDSKR